MNIYNHAQAKPVSRQNRQTPVLHGILAIAPVSAWSRIQSVTANCARPLRLIEISLALLAALLGVTAAAQAVLSPSPPLGWNSFDSYGVFNRTDRLKTVALTPSFLGLEPGARLFDVWKGRKEHKLAASSAIEIDVNPDGVLFLRYE